MSGPGRPGTQRSRVLAALRAHPAGVNETAFAAPRVLDGGSPILRVAARIFELRSEGHDIRTARERNGTATYRLRVTAVADGRIEDDRAGGHGQHQR